MTITDINPPRIKPTFDTRPLNETEKGKSLLMSASIHYMIRMMDQLSHTSIFNQRLKQTSKIFLADLEKHASKQLWKQEVEGSDINKAVDQMEDIVTLYHNLLMVALQIGNLHEAQHSLFWEDMQKTFKRFNVPLRLSPDGTLEVIEK